MLVDSGRVSGQWEISVERLTVGPRRVSWLLETASDQMLTETQEPGRKRVITHGPAVAALMSQIHVR